MARLVPADEIDTYLSKAKGWLEDDDPFFDAIDGIVKERAKHIPTCLNDIWCVGQWGLPKLKKIK